VDEFRRLNPGVTNIDRIYPGQVLTLPDSKREIEERQRQEAERLRQEVERRRAELLRSVISSTVEAKKWVNVLRRDWGRKDSDQDMGYYVYCCMKERLWGLQDKGDCEKLKNAFNLGSFKPGDGINGHVQWARDRNKERKAYLDTVLNKSAEAKNLYQVLLRDHGYVESDIDLGYYFSVCLKENLWGLQDRGEAAKLRDLYMMDSKFPEDRYSPTAKVNAHIQWARDQKNKREKEMAQRKQTAPAAKHIDPLPKDLSKLSTEEIQRLLDQRQ